MGRDTLWHASPLAEKRGEKLKKSLKLATIAFFALTIVLAAQTPLSFANSATEILITPNIVNVQPEENFTLTLNVTNVTNLFAWQVALKYNGTIINCTGVWTPEDNVFGGKLTVPVEPVYGKDYKDGLSYVLYGYSLLSPPGVTVSTGVLFKLNFTALEAGATTIVIATKESPAWQDQLLSWDSYLLDDKEPGNEIPFHGGSSTIICGEANAPPIAKFTATPSAVNATGKLVLLGNPPAGGAHYVQTFKGVPVTFNASGSYDPDGRVTLYKWDFGDGVTAEVSDPVITHAYNSTGQFVVTLVVVDNGTEPLSSKAVSTVIVVGLVLDLFDWMPYVYGLTAVFVVLVAVYSVNKAVKSRRKLKL